MLYDILLYVLSASDEILKANCMKSPLDIAKTSEKSLTLAVAYLGSSEKNEISPIYISSINSLMYVFVFLWRMHIFPVRIKNIS